MRIAAILATGFWVSILVGPGAAEPVSPDAGPFSASFTRLPALDGRDMSRAFPHGHPLHVCGPEDDTHPWLQERPQDNPWSFMRGESEREANALR